MRYSAILLASITAFSAPALAQNSMTPAPSTAPAATTPAPTGTPATSTAPTGTPATSTPGTPAAAVPGSATATTPAATATTPTVGADGKVVLAAGVEVKGPNGGDVGKITEVKPAPDGSGSLVTVDTGTVKAVIPSSSFALTETNAVIGFNRDQLNAAASAAQPQPAGAQPQP